MNVCMHNSRLRHTAELLWRCVCCYGFAESGTFAVGLSLFFFVCAPCSCLSIGGFSGSQTCMTIICMCYMAIDFESLHNAFRLLFFDWFRNIAFIPVSGYGPHRNIKWAGHAGEHERYSNALASCANRISTFNFVIILFRIALLPKN